METISEVNYPTNTLSNQIFLFHRGPGCFRSLCEVVAYKLANSVSVYAVDNSTHTEKVRRAVDNVLSEVIQAGFKAPAVNSKEPVFGQYDFAGVVGLWLKAGQAEASQYLSPFISTDSFTFTPEEYLDLRDRLQQTIRRAERLPLVSSALEDLNTGFFRHQTLAESETFIKTHLERYLERAKTLKAAYLVAINRYARNATFQRRRELMQREEQLQVLLQQAKRIERLKGRRGRKAKQALDRIQNDYLLRWRGVETQGGNNFAAFAEEEATAISAEKKALIRELSSANLSLSEVTAEPELGDKAELSALAADLEQLIEKIDESGLFQLPIGGAAAATASRQLQRLEGVLQRLNNSYCHLPELPDFYAHRNFWYAQPARLRRLLAPLQDLPPEDWEPAFTSWYFERCLEQFAYEQRPKMEAIPAPDNADILGDATEEKDVLRNLILLQPGDPVPPEATVVVDFTGQACPADFAGEYYSKRPITDVTARHYNLAGVVDPRLVLLQTFVPISPPEWKPVQVEQPPPGTGNAIALQMREEAPWVPLSDWKPEPTKDLRLYLPVTFSEDCGTAFLSLFEVLVGQSDRLTIFHEWSPDRITQALLSDGLNPAFLMAALLRAAEACTESPYDQEALMAVGKEVRGRCKIVDPAPHPLAVRLEEQLQKQLPDYFFTLHQPWRDTFLPLVILSPAGKKTVLLPGGKLPGYANQYNEAQRQQELKTAGLDCQSVNAYACWEDFPGVVSELVESLKKDDPK